MAPKLYSHPLSPNCRKVVALGLELGLPIETVMVDLMKGGHKEPAYLAKNPNGKVPVLEEDGWQEVRHRGSHRQLKHPRKPGLVTLPGKPSDELAPGTLNSVLKQAGLKA